VFIEGRRFFTGQTVAVRSRNPAEAA